MRLTKLKPGERGVVVKIMSASTIKSRLEALGLVKGTDVTMIQHTLAKNTYEVMADDTRIALRQEEAETVEVVHEDD